MCVFVCARVGGREWAGGRGGGSGAGLKNARTEERRQCQSRPPRVFGGMKNHAVRYTNTERASRGPGPTYDLMPLQQFQKDLNTFGSRPAPISSTGAARSISSSSSSIGCVVASACASRPKRVKFCPCPGSKPKRAAWSAMAIVLIRNGGEFPGLGEREYPLAVLKGAAFLAPGEQNVDP